MANVQFWLFKFWYWFSQKKIKTNGTGILHHGKNQEVKALVLKLKSERPIESKSNSN